MIKVKNTTASSDIWCGMTIAPSDYYELQSSEVSKWQNDSKVLIDVASGNLIVNNGTNDVLDVALAINHLKEIVPSEVDTDGRQVTRTAAGKPGWSYLAHPIEFQTAKFGSVYEINSLGVSRGISSAKFYDVANVEVTDPAYESSIVKTVVLVKPGYDFELVAGTLQQITSPDSDVRIWVVGGVIELGGPYVKEFCGGLNMSFYSANESVRTDGRAAKYMKKDISGLPYQANQIQIIVRHSAGYQHRLMLTLEYFRA